MFLTLIWRLVNYSLSNNDSSPFVYRHGGNKMKVEINVGLFLHVYVIGPQYALHIYKEELERVVREVLYFDVLTVFSAFNLLV